MGNPGEITGVLVWDNAISVSDASKKKVSDHLLKIPGVKSIREMDIGKGPGKAIINISDPKKRHEVKRKFQEADNRRKNVELILLEKRPLPQPPLDPKETQIELRPQISGNPNTALHKTNKCSHSELKKIDYNKRFTCDECKEDGFGIRYKCVETKCGYELHKECKEGHRTKTIKTIKLFNETFAFCGTRPKEGERCNACGGHIYGCFYKSEKRKLHPRCSSFKAKISVQDTIVRLSKKDSEIKCLWCKKNVPQGWSYVSDCWRLHLCCVPEMWQYHWKASNHDISKTLITIDSKLELKAKSKKNGASWKSILDIAILLVRVAIFIVLADPTGLLIGVAQQGLNSVFN